MSDFPITKRRALLKKNKCFRIHKPNSPNRTEKASLILLPDDPHLSRYLARANFKKSMPVFNTLGKRNRNSTEHNRDCEVLLGLTDQPSTSRSFSWMPPKPPFDIMATTSPSRRSGARLSMMASASASVSAGFPVAAMFATRR